MTELQLKIEVFTTANRKQREQPIRAKKKCHTEPWKTGASVRVANVLGFHVIGCEVDASFRDQSTSHVIPNNLPNSLEYSY